MPEGSFHTFDPLRSRTPNGPMTMGWLGAYGTQEVRTP